MFFTFPHLLVASVLWLASSRTSFAANGAAPGSSESVQQDYDLKIREYRLTLFGSIGTAFALAFGYYQYRKADRWKRAEFLAKEMKEFFDDADVRNVLLMIDWAPRRINLFLEENKDPKAYPKVTRELQVSALMPHILRVSDGGSDPQGDHEIEATRSESEKRNFSMEEARVRDSYDRFLDYLERFASYTQSGLVSTKELDPYLRYWVKDIAAYTNNAEDADWTCAVMAYIEFYDFNNVQRLFYEYGYEITTSGPIFEKQSAVMAHPELGRKLREACAGMRR